MLKYVPYLYERVPTVEGSFHSRYLWAGDVPSLPAPTDKNVILLNKFIIRPEGIKVLRVNRFQADVAPMSTHGIDASYKEFQESA